MELTKIDPLEQLCAELDKAIEAAEAVIPVLKAADEFVSAILEKRGEMNDAAYPAGLQALPLLKQIRAALGKVEGEGK